MKSNNNNLKCSSCSKEFDSLFVFDCQKCVGKKCPTCGKKKIEGRYGLIDYDSQLKCFRCGKKKSFLFLKYEFQGREKRFPYCGECREKDDFPSEQACLCQTNKNNFSHCNLCNDKLLPLECLECHVKKFKKEFSYEGYKDSKKRHEDYSFESEKIPKIKEKRIFFIKVLIKDNDGKIKMLKKEQEMEIEWRGGTGKLGGFKFGGLSEGEKVKIIRFQDSGKNYDVAIGWLHAQKGWFGDKITVYKAEPVPINAFKIIKQSDKIGPKSRWQESQGIKRHCIIKNHQRRRQGKIMIGILFFLTTIAIFMFIAWKIKKRKRGKTKKSKSKK